MKKEIFVKIPLEERLNRIAAGHASSPQYSRKIVDAFCEAPVIPALECIGAYGAREELCRLLKSDHIKLYFGPKDVENVTFGDIAGIIAEHYMKYGAAPAEEVRPLTDAILQIIGIYFMSFELIRQQEAEYRHFTRSDVDPFLLSVYDFLHSSFADYYNYIAMRGSSKYTDKIDACCTEKGMSQNMNPMMIYEELQPDAKYADDYTMSSFEKCEHLIDFFVCPVALITQRENLSINN